MESNITPIPPAPDRDQVGKVKKPEILFPFPDFEDMATFRPVPVCVN